MSSGGGGSGGDADEDVAAMDPSMGVGVPGVDPNVEDPGDVQTGGDLGITNDDVAAAGAGDFGQNLGYQMRQSSALLNPTPANISRAVVTSMIPGGAVFSGLAHALNAMGATPGNDIDAYGPGGLAASDQSMGDDSGPAPVLPPLAQQPMQTQPPQSIAQTPSPSMLGDFQPRYPVGGIGMTDPLPSPIPGYGTLMRGYRGPRY